MNYKSIGERIKSLRNENAISQEELSAQTGLSLRTIQRIENNETTPRADSLKRLANYFKINLTELKLFHLKENRNYLQLINFSGLLNLIFPFLGVLFPWLLWTIKKDEIKNIDQVSKSVLNFQILWALIFYSLLIHWVIKLTTVFDAFELVENKTPEILTLLLGGSIYLKLILISFGLLVFFQLITAVVNSIKIHRKKPVLQPLFFNLLKLKQ